MTGYDGAPLNFGPNRPIVHTRKRKGAYKTNEPKLCPTCLNVLKLVDKQWECPRGHKQAA